MKRSLIAAAAALLSISTLTACSGTPASTSSTGGNLRIMLVAKANASDYWTAVKEGAMQAGKDLGVTVTFNGPDTESEGDKQLNMLQSAVTDKPAGIGFAPQDGAQDGAPGILDQAKAAGIPVVAFDTPVNNSDVPIATVASDNAGIGAMAAQHMVELTGGKGNIAIIAHGLTGTALARQQGFQDYIAEKAPGMTIVDVQNGESDPAKSRDKAQGILQAHPDLVGFFGTDDDSAIACASEVQSKGLTGKVKVVGVDASADEISLVKAGQITGAVTQNPYNIGYQTVQILLDAAKGTPPKDKNIVSESVWYTADNMDDPTVAQVLGNAAA
ncbi:MAG: ABC transporter substrate-binding protein [Propionibacteriaceae bacterium]|jgi:ribose transport system substrate-binding protein|nr:ABC transporter substrate-binding protein [Propionibacteriaceae bacterium]